MKWVTEKKFKMWADSTPVDWKDHPDIRYMYYAQPIYFTKYLKFKPTNYDLCMNIFGGVNDEMAISNLFIRFARTYQIKPTHDKADLIIQWAGQYFMERRVLDLLEK